jgi:hypothetical protein
LLALLLAISTATAQAQPPLVPRELDSLESSGEALIQLAPGAQRAARRLRAGGGVRLSRGLRIWRVPAATARRLVPELALSGALREFEPSRRRAPIGLHGAGDALFVDQGWVAPVGADLADPPGAGVPVVVVDSGLDLSHPEFADRPHTTALNAQTLSGRREFHGTAVSSVVGAPANGLGVVGVYPLADLRAWDASPAGVLTTADVVAGIEALGPGPGVINLSLGGSNRSRIEEDSILRALGRGWVVVAAVGNSGRAEANTFPATLPHVLTVASTDRLGRASTFSNSSPAVDVAAPGEDVPVAVPFSFSPTGFLSADGTSLAAPMVAGAAGWLWTLRGDLDATQVVEILRRSARDAGRPGRDNSTGFGVLDIPRALAAPTPAQDPLEPNDNVEQVRPRGLSEAGKPALVGALSARLEGSRIPATSTGSGCPAEPRSSSKSARRARSRWSCGVPRRGPCARRATCDSATWPWSAHRPRREYGGSSSPAVGRRTHTSSSTSPWATR